MAAEHVNRRFNPSRIWSSDLARCVQTAEALATPFRRTPTLREVDLGQWEGLRWADLQDENAEWVGKYFAGDPTFQAPGGELLSDVVERGRRFMQEADLTTPQGDVVVVGHGGALKGLIVALLEPADRGDGQVRVEQREPHHRGHRSRHGPTPIAQSDSAPRAARLRS